MNELAQNNQPSEDQPTPGDQPLETAQPTRKFKITWQFTAGFLGWFLVNGVFWLLLSGGIKLDEYEILDRLCFVLPLNLVTLIGLIWIKKTRQVAQGILAALGLNFFVSLVLGLFYNSFCLIPFFIDSP
jgi:hypothetical protein